MTIVPRGERYRHLWEYSCQEISGYGGNRWSRGGLGVAVEEHLEEVDAESVDCSEADILLSPGYRFDLPIGQSASGIGAANFDADT